MINNESSPGKNLSNSGSVIPLKTELQIRHRIAELAALLVEEYQGRDVVIVGILKGAFMFAADLLRRLYDLGLYPDIDFIRAASYGSDDKSSGEVKIELDISIDVAGRSLLIVDDIVDSGRTLQLVKQHLLGKGAKDVKICVLLDKPSRREVECDLDWVGFEIPDHFVVGYGMDYAEKYRYLPFITTVEQAGVK